MPYDTHVLLTANGDTVELNRLKEFMANVKNLVKVTQQETREHGVQFQYSTDNAEPSEGIEVISKLFPTLDFELEYDTIRVHYFKLWIRNGEVEDTKEEY